MGGLPNLCHLMVHQSPVWTGMARRVVVSQAERQRKNYDSIIINRQRQSTQDNCVLLRNMMCNSFLDHRSLKPISADCRSGETDRQTDTHTIRKHNKGNWGYPIILTCMFWVMGGKRSTQRNPHVPNRCKTTCRQDHCIIQLNITWLHYQFSNFPSVLGYIAWNRFYC